MQHNDDCFPPKQGKGFNAAELKFEQVFSDIADRQIQGCFERLVCDISANPRQFKSSRLVSKNRFIMCIDCTVKDTLFMKAAKGDLLVAYSVHL